MTEPNPLGKAPTFTPLGEVNLCESAVLLHQLLIRNLTIHKSTTIEADLLKARMAIEQVVRAYSENEYIVFAKTGAYHLLGSNL